MCAGLLGVTGFFVVVGILLLGFFNCGRAAFESLLWSASSPKTSFSNVVVSRLFWSRLRIFFILSSSSSLSEDNSSSSSYS